MIVKPHIAPWDGEAGLDQHRFGVRNACLLAREFLKAGFDVVILDVVSDETLGAYKEMLRDCSFKIVLLLPTFEEVQRRSQSRSEALRPEEIVLLYQAQSRFQGFDERIDNSQLSVAEAAERLNRLMA